MEALRQMEYHFNNELELRHIQTGEAFKFINQNHYEKLADAVADFIQEIMVEDYSMIRMELPFAEHLSDIEEDYEEGAASVTCPIFVSSNYEEADVILVLLCGTGRVAAGQWARKLCINDSLKMGSVLPFLKWAKEHSFGVIVLNPNKNFVEAEEGSKRVIPLNESAEAHVSYAWKAVCESFPAKHFVLIAHSYGGISTCNLLEHQGKEVLERLRCIAFTDSAHSFRLTEVLPEAAKEFLATHCVNWASSSKPLDTILAMPSSREGESSSKEKKTGKNFFEQLRTRGSMCKVVSAGTDVHEETTMSAFPSICKFLLDQLESAGAVV